jgi:hypothetical protein
MPDEIWKQVVGWPDYAVSDRGRVSSFKRGRIGRLLKLRCKRTWVDPVVVRVNFRMALRSTMGPRLRALHRAEDIGSALK